MMKHHILAGGCLIVLIGVLGLSACSQNSEATETPENTKTQEAAVDSSGEASSSDEDEDDGGTISSNKGLTSVEVTLPASLFQDMTPEQIKSAAKENGVSEVAVNSDGSVTYKMSQEIHQKILDDLKSIVDESIQETLSDKNTYPSFTDITYEDDMSLFTVSCDQSLYTEYQAFAALNFVIQGIYYQALNGGDSGTANVLVNFVDKDTNEVLYTYDSSNLTDPS